MHRVKLADRVLPTYTKGEEIFNMVSHIVGGALGIAVLALCVIFSALHHNVYGIVSTSIYGVSLILLYTMSSIYHGLNPNRTAKKVFQIIDHCSIFILIAGTYTPFALCTLREYDTATGWTLFGIVWGLSILGIVLNSIDLKRYKVDSASIGGIMNNYNYINNLIVWTVFVEDVKNNVIRAYARSRGPIINKLFEQYNGGGHMYACGAKLNSFSEADEIIEKLNNMCKTYNIEENN